MTDYPLPSDTKAAYERFDRCQNPGLLFERYAPDLRSGDHLKKPALEDVRRCDLDHRALSAYRSRWRALVEGADAISFEAKAAWRFVTGLGGKGPLEVGFTFHRIYGFPIIPGSGLKGLARAWAYFTLKANDPESDPEKDPDFVAVFGREPEGDGDTGSAGGAVFFEAIPISRPELDLDVMNPHYPDYYSGDDPPNDGQNPKPVFFLTVKPGVRFAFAIGWRGAPDAERHQLAVEWLQRGLEELGAGAKTSAGYGYWEMVTEAEEPSGPPEPELPPGYVRGRVTVFGLGDRRSYGFIAPLAGGDDVFVHLTGLADGVETLEEGQEVIFKTEDTPKGKQAQDVRSVNG